MGAIGTLKDEKMKITNREYKEERSKESEEDKYKLIEIYQDTLDKIISTPIISHGKYFLLIENLLIQKDLHIYWKA